jgi:hypothetical protein
VFDSKHWFKETIVLMVLLGVISLVVSLFVPFPYSYPIIFGIVILIVWAIHRRSRNVPHSPKV